MFGLPQQVHSAQFSVYAVVGNHQRFGWPCKQVNANSAIELALGLGHKHIARAYQHVDRCNRLRTNRHSRHGLHTAQHQNLVRACQVHGRHNGRMRRTMKRRCCGNDALDTRHFCCQHTHVGRCNQGVFTAGHVAAHGVHGNVFVPKHHTWHGFNLYVPH